MTSATPPTSPAARTIPLTQLRVGQTGVVASASLDADDAKLLGAMGLAEGASVRLCRAGQPCIVAVGGIDAEACGCAGSCRIGLARPLADRIQVTVLA